MALAVKQLDGAAFLLTFEPLQTDDLPPPSHLAEPFRVLLDPGAAGSGYGIDTSPPDRHLPIPIPDVVVLSDSDANLTLQDLPPTGTKTVILARAPAADAIRSWRHFPAEQVVDLPRWEDPRGVGARRVSVAAIPDAAGSDLDDDPVVRVEVPPVHVGGQAGEVTVSLVCAAAPKKRDSLLLMRSGSNAGGGGRSAPQSTVVGITYRPPTPAGPPNRCRTTVSSKRVIRRPSVPQGLRMHNHHHHQQTSLLLPPSPPLTPLTQVRSKSTSKTRSTASGSTAMRNQNRVLSVIFAPRGASWSSAVEPLATSHLVAEAALPLTALLHPFDEVDRRRSLLWRRAGSRTTTLGMAAGLETAVALGARAWVGVRGGEGGPDGAAGRRRPHGLGEVRGAIERALSAPQGNGSTNGSRSGRADVVAGTRKSCMVADRPTEVFGLAVDEEISMVGEGVCQPAASGSGSGSGSGSEESSWSPRTSDDTAGSSGGVSGTGAGAGPVVRGRRSSYVVTKYGLGDILANLSADPFAGQEAPAAFSVLPPILDETAGAGGETVRVGDDEVEGRPF